MGLGVAFVGAVIAILESIEADIGHRLDAGGEGAFGHLDCAAAIPRADLDDVCFAGRLDRSGQQFTKHFVTGR